MVIPTAIVVGLLCGTLVKFSDSAFVGLAIFFMLPFVLPMLMNHLLFARLYEPKARSLIVLAHLGYSTLLSFVWMFSVWPFAQSTGIYYFFLLAGPFLIVCWVTACFLNRSMGKESSGEGRSRHDPPLMIPDDCGEEAKPE